MAEIEIDGQHYSIRTGDNLLKTCLEQRLDLPYFCWHPALGSVGACRQCAVIQYQNAEDQRGRLVMACMTPVAEGMRFSLQDPQAQGFRAGIIELLMSNHPHDCPVCEEGGECHLQDMTEMTGHTFRQYRGRKRTHRNQNLGPFINHEMNRCIACYRCVRYYQDYCGGHDLQVFAAHHHVYFGRHEDGALENEFSGNLVEVCPTGVFTDKTFSRHYTRKWDLQSAPSICPHCAIGCNISPGERYGTLRRIANRYHGEINGYFLCDRGRFGYEFVNSDRRIHRSLLRNQPPLGMKGVVNLFSNLLKKSDGIIGIASPRASLEANFALRELVGAEHFHLGFSGSEQVQIAAILDILRQGPVRVASLREVEQADAIFMLGEDVANTAPRLALSLRQAIRNEAFAIADRLKIPRWQDAAVRTCAQSQGSPLFIASFAATRLDDVATDTYRGGPEELARLGYAVARHLNPAAQETMELNPEFDELAARIASALKSAERPLIVSGTGCQSPSVTRAAGQVACVLADLRGKPSAVHFVLPECNSLGLAMMGGHSLAEAFLAVERGEAKTVIVLENDLYRRAAKPRVKNFLEQAGHVVVIDHLLHETAQQAELVLAATTFAESEGTWVSSEGRAQRYFAVFPPTDEIQDSWRWLGKAGGKSWRSIEEVTKDCAERLPAFRAITWAAPEAGFRINGQKIPRQPHRYSGRTAMLAQAHTHEPKQPADEQSPLAYSMEGALAGRPPALNPSVWAPGWNSSQAVNQFQAEIGGHLNGGDPGMRLIEPSAENPSELATGMSDAIQNLAPIMNRQAWRLRLVPLYHVFGSEELSMLSPALAERTPNPYLALHPEDASALDLKEGDTVGIKLAGQQWRLPVLILPNLTRGLAGIPAGLPEMAWVEQGPVFWDLGG
ncbi:MAG: NADH-quinone oxidoreductase subunit NuoG [Methylococcaceae bacterium]|nr:NADH-quinone oxidoreductase subunit NuoG [Methylococcaceae bacterium]